MNKFSEARAILQPGIAARVFPGAVFGVEHRGEVFIEAVGRLGYADEWPVVTGETIYDLASLTKVMATTALAMKLWQDGKLRLDMPVCELLPRFCRDDARRAQVTLEMLLAHTSGLPAYRPLFELPAVAQAANAEARRAAVVEAAFNTELTANPGECAEYSDIGFIVLGEALATLSGGGERAEVCQRAIFHPLELKTATYLPARELWPHIAPTCDWNWRRRVLQGEVQDENCAAMGGVAGHAGVFADCADVLRFAASVLAPGNVFAHETVVKFSEKISGSRALGWDTPSSPSQSGKYFSPRSIGHLGYTGTSLWIDLERGIAVALLTNRVYTGKDAPPLLNREAIAEVRPRFYDAVMRELLHL